MAEREVEHALAELGHRCFMLSSSMAFGWRKPIAALAVEVEQDRRVLNQPCVHGMIMRYLRPQTLLQGGQEATRLTFNLLNGLLDGTIGL